MKKDHLSALDLSLGVHTVEISLKGKSGEKKEACKGEKFSSPCPSFSSDSHAI